MIIDVVMLENDTFIRPDVIDNFSSLIWADRFNSVGDIELTLPITDTNLAIVRPDIYLEINESDKTMYLEKIVLESSKDGGTIKATGRSLESILDRRILHSTVILDGNIQNGIEKILNDNIISPDDPKRKIPNFVFLPSSDPAITELTIGSYPLEAGLDLLEIVTKICTAASIGFKIIRDEDKFVFSLFAGEDRTYNQEKNPYVVFSNEFDNLSNSSYLLSIDNYKNSAFVYSSVKDNITYIETIGDTEGLKRREIYIDASSLEKEIDGVEKTEEEYRESMRENGITELSNRSIDELFEGEADASRPYVYGEDFFMGDIVQISDDFGNEGIVRVTELIISQNNDGYSIYPTFTTISEEEVI